MLRRLTGFAVSAVLMVQMGCGGGSTPPPATNSAQPPASAPGGPIGAVDAAAEETAAPAVTDAYATIPNNVSAVVIRVPKLLESPVGASEAAASVTDGLKNDFGLEPAQVNEVILVFMGGSGSSAIPSSPYGGGGAPYGPPTGSPYGPPPGSPYGRSATSAPAVATGADESSGGSLMPSMETTVRIIRATAAIDQAKVRTALGLETTETPVGQFTFFGSTQADGDAVCFLDDQTLIVGRENTLQSYFTSSASASSTGSPYGPPPSDDEEAAAPVVKTLGELLREAPPELAVFAAKKNSNAELSAAALMPAVGGTGANLVSMLSAYVTAVPEGSIGVDLASGAKVLIDIPAPTADGAQQLWSGLQGAQGLFGIAIEAQKVALTTGATAGQPNTTAKLFEAGEQFVKTMKVERGGENNQHVLISGSIDQPTVESLAGAMKRDLLVPPGSEVARKKVESQLKQLGVAAHTHLAEQGKLPTAAIMSADGMPLLSWRVALLPYLGQKELYDQFKLDEPWNSEHNQPLVEKMPSVYAVPGVSEKGKTTLVAPVGEKTVFGHKGGATLVMASDGPSFTILTVQANDDRAVTWTAPDDLTFDAAKPTQGIDKTYPGVFLALWLDGQVHTIALNTTTATAAGLFTYAGGESVDLNALMAAAATAATAPANATTSESGAPAAETKTAKSYPSGWAGDAQRAVDLGHDKEAARLILAVAITADDEALKTDVMHWNKMARPVHMLRWGVGVMPDPKRRAEPVGGANTGGVANPYGRGFGTSTSSDDGDEEAVDPRQEFNDLAGEVGQDMIKEIRKRLDKGEFGKLFEYDRKETEANTSSGAAGFRFEGARSPYGPNGPSAGTPSASAAPTTEELDAVAERASRGLAILGKGDRKKLLTAAAEAEVDVLLIAEMTTKNSRSTDPAIRWVVVDVATKKNVGRDSDPVPLPNAGGGGAGGYGGSFGTQTGGDQTAIANADAAARRKNTAEWLKAMDEALKFKEVPDLAKPEVADKVVKQAAKMVGAGGQENPLPVLLELRYYQVLGTLQPADALPLVTKLLKDDAKAETFVNGTPEERKSLLENWILPVPSGPAEANVAADS